MKPKTIDADALLGYLQGKWDENKRIRDHRLINLGTQVQVNHSKFLSENFTSQEYRDFILNIFEECALLDMIHSSSELVLMITKQFGLQLK